ncbi:MULTISPECIES: MATE family efflux transporter [unclassified Campylobacter]|uniref:MATE family efflux transporter n=1 Tax=unclassified Campylobacter TaxID=2593542 RepID=UPI003D32E999
MQPKSAQLFSNKDIFKLCLPIIIEQFLEHFVGLVASFMAAHVSEDALSSVSLVEFVMALFISVFTAIATGGGVITGQYLGANDEKNAKNTATQLIWLCFGISLFVMLLMYLFKDAILDILFVRITAEVRQGASIYLLFTTAAVPFIAIYAAAAAIFRAAGNTKLPMFIMLFANFLNLVFAAMAVYVLNFGIFALAICMFLARFLAAVIAIWFLLDDKNKLCIDKSFRYKFNAKIVRKILNIGMPYGFENGMFYLGRILVFSIVALFGTAAIAANSVGGTISIFQVLAGFSIGMGLSVVVSRCVGAGEYEQAKIYAKKGIFIVFCVHIITTLFTFLFLEQILAIYSLSVEAENLARQIVLWHGVVTMLIWPLSFTFPQLFRAAGDSKFAMKVSIVSMFVCRVFLAYVFSVWCEFGMMGTWYAMFVDWVVRAVFFTFRFKKGVWLKFKTV